MMYVKLRNVLIDLFPCSRPFVDPVEPRERSEQRPIDTSCHELGYWVNELLPSKKYTARPLNQLQLE